MTKQYKAVGVFPSRLETETALRELIKKHGFPSEQVSVVAQHKEDDHLNDLNDLDYEETEGDRASTSALGGGLTGGTLGGITGLLIGLGTLAIPGIGPIMLAGAASTAIATTIAGGAIGTAAGTLVGGLVGLGIPKEKAKAYRTRVVQGGYLVIVEGTIDEIQLTEEILKQYRVEDWEVYDAFETDSVQTTEYAEVPQQHVGVVEEPLPARATVIEKPILSHHLRMMGAFPRLREAKTALLELIETGYSIDHVTLFINKDDRHDWFPNLKVCDALDYSFNRLSEDRRLFFQDCFDRGQYILMIDGTDAQIREVELALRTKGIHGFYIFDPYDNGNAIVSNIPLSNPSPLYDDGNPTKRDIPLSNSRPLVEIIDNRI